MGKGSCRSYGGFNLFAALESCSDLLVDFGGHELAAGFNIREEDIPAFRRRMNHCVCDYCNGETPVSSLEVDVTIRDPSCITLEEMEHLDRLEPYGAGNNRPVFALMGAKVESLQNVGQNRHLKLRLSKGPYHFDAIFSPPPPGSAARPPGCGWTPPFTCRSTSSGASAASSSSWWICAPPSCPACGSGSAWSWWSG